MRDTRDAPPGQAAHAASTQPLNRVQRHAQREQRHRLKLQQLQHGSNLPYTSIAQAEAELDALRAQIEATLTAMGPTLDASTHAFVAGVMVATSMYQRGDEPMNALLWFLDAAARFVDRLPQLQGIGAADVVDRGIRALNDFRAGSPAALMR
jgi:hypothetical protein